MIIIKWIIFVFAYNRLIILNPINEEIRII